MEKKEYLTDDDRLHSDNELNAMEIDELFENALNYFNIGYGEYKFESFFMFKKVIERNPNYLNQNNDDTAHFYLGLMCRDDMNDIDSAIKYMTKAIELNPTDGWSFVIRGYCYKEKGDYNKALTDLRMAKENGGDEFDPEIDSRIREVEELISK